MEIESKISVKKNNGEVVSADVMLYNDVGDVVKRITIIDSEVLQALEGRVDGFQESYIDYDKLYGILRNSDNNTSINATKLGNVSADNYALRTSIPTVLEPTVHESTTGKYGLGSTTKYGHVKLRNDLSASAFISGEALSSFQGARLDNRLRIVEGEVDSLEEKEKVKSLSLKIGRESDREGFSSDRITIAQGSKILIKGYSSDDNFDWNGKRITIYVNGGFYDRTMNRDGECGLQVNLNAGEYLVVAFKGDSSDGRDGCSIVKKVVVYEAD